MLLLAKADVSSQRFMGHALIPLKLPEWGRCTSKYGYAFLLLTWRDREGTVWQF